MYYSRPHTGAWIETTATTGLSRPTSGRPHTGAWIETTITPLMTSANGCRPHTGAWIETFFSICFRLRAAVAPIRGRGLKHVVLVDALFRYGRPPYGGVD